MPYILYNANGSTLFTVDDGTANDSTSLTFVGRNYSGYGQIQNQNFVYLLENFSKTTPPPTPIQGQLWFNNNINQRNLNVCYDGVNFKSIANLVGQSVDPSLSYTPLDGDLWWNTTSIQLNSWSSEFGKWITIGPYNSVESVASWQPVTEIGTDGNNHNILKGYIGSDPVAVISNFNFSPVSSSDLYTNFLTVQSGITLKEANAAGSTQATGSYFWGTAAESLMANTATTVAINIVSTGTYCIPFIGDPLGNQPLYSTGTLSYNVFTQVLNATATAAQYADLAERYEADAVYDEGTVLIIGGEKEVTVTTQFADTRVAGIVSKNPAYLMNKDAGNDETHPAIALKGRVPCKVLGYINKGDLIVTSSTPGYGIAASNVFGGAIIGKALGSQSEGFGVIEVLVV